MRETALLNISVLSKFNLIQYTFTSGLYVQDIQLSFYFLDEEKYL